MPTYVIDIYIFLSFILLLLCQQYKSVLDYFALYCVVEVLLFQGMVNLFTILFPIFVFGRYMVISTRISEFSLALEKLKVPLGIQIILLVMIRYFPTIKSEFRSIFNAMRLRGVNFSPIGFMRHPVKTVEYLYVPLVYSLIKTGDELSVAALTRGLGLYESRTYLVEIGFTYRDRLIAFIYLAVLVFGFLGKGGAL
ncbi:MAG: energy-coupling factor transporter transmembrane component T [Eubacteriales bacterium]|nr:energy-coupling factor transporter transmembrane component T [Eubacteriales bacterium]